MDMIIRCEECNENMHRRNYKIGSSVCKPCEKKDNGEGKIELIREILSFKDKFSRGV